MRIWETIDTTFQKGGRPVPSETYNSQYTHFFFLTVHLLGNTDGKTSSLLGHLQTPNNQKWECCTNSLFFKENIAWGIKFGGKRQISIHKIILESVPLLTSWSPSLHFHYWTGSFLMSLLELFSVLVGECVSSVLAPRH